MVCIVYTLLNLLGHVYMREKTNKSVEFVPKTHCCTTFYAGSI